MPRNFSTAMLLGLLCWVVIVWCIWMVFW